MRKDLGGLLLLATLAAAAGCGTPAGGQRTPATPDAPLPLAPGSGGGAGGSPGMTSPVPQAPPPQPAPSPIPSASPTPASQLTSGPITDTPIAQAAAAYAAHQSFLGSGMSGPNGLAIDGADNLYEADYFRGTITRVTPSGQVSTYVGGLTTPAGPAFDPSGHMYVAEYDAGVLAKVPPGGGSFAPFATSGLHHPVWPAVDSHGTIYLADYDDGRIAKVAPDGSVSTFVNLGSVNAISIDDQDNLWACTWGGMVAKITPSGQMTTITSGLGTADGIAWSSGYLALVEYGGETSRNGQLMLVGFSGQTYPVASGLDRSSSVIFDSQGNIYTADVGDTALRKYSLH